MISKIHSMTRNTNNLSVIKKASGKNKRRNLFGISSQLRSLMLNINTCIDGIRMESKTFVSTLLIDMLKPEEVMILLFFMIVHIQESRKLILSDKFKKTQQN